MKSYLDIIDEYADQFMSQVCRLEQDPSYIKTGTGHIKIIDDDGLVHTIPIFKDPRRGNI